MLKHEMSDFACNG